MDKIRFTFRRHLIGIVTPLITSIEYTYQPRIKEGMCSVIVSEAFADDLADLLNVKNIEFSCSPEK